MLNYKIYQYKPTAMYHNTSANLNIPYCITSFEGEKLRIWYSQYYDNHESYNMKYLHERI